MNLVVVGSSHYYMLGLTKVLTMSGGSQVFLEN